MKKILFAALILCFSCPAFGALPSDTVWEVRPTNGDNTNGACVDASVVAGTTDYSQQDAAQLSLTDLATDGAGTGLSSATGGFTAQMVGNCVRINSGTGLTVGWYMITAYTDTNNVTIDRSAGASGSSGAGKVGGATASIGSQTTTNLCSVLTDGHKVWIKNETWSGDSCTTADTAGYTLPIVLEGYNTSRNDQPTGSNRPQMDGGDTGGDLITLSHAHWLFANIIFANAGDDGFQIGNWLTDNFCVNCRVTSCVGAGIESGMGNGYMFGLYASEVDNNGAYGITGPNLFWFGSELHDNASGGTDSGGGQFFNSLIYDNSGDGINAAWNRGVSTMNCTIDGNTGDGIQNDDVDSYGYDGFAYYNTIISNNGAYGLNVTSATSPAVDKFLSRGNAFYNNTTADYSSNFYFDSTFSTEGTDPGYTSRAGADYSIGTNLKAAGQPSTFPAGTTTSYIDPGAAQREEPAGGGSSEHAYTFVG